MACWRYNGPDAIFEYQLLDTPTEACTGQGMYVALPAYDYHQAIGLDPVITTTYFGLAQCASVSPSNISFLNYLTPLECENFGLQVWDLADSYQSYIPDGPLNNSVTDNATSTVINMNFDTDLYNLGYSSIVEMWVAGIGIGMLLAMVGKLKR